MQRWRQTARGPSFTTALPSRSGIWRPTRSSAPHLLMKAVLSRSTALRSPRTSAVQCVYAPADPWSGPLAQAGVDGSGGVLFWDVSSGKAIHTPEKAVGSYDFVAYSPDGKRVVTGGKTLDIWDSENAALLRRLNPDGDGTPWATASPSGAW